MPSFCRFPSSSLDVVMCAASIVTLIQTFAFCDSQFRILLCCLDLLLLFHLASMFDSRRENVTSAKKVGIWLSKNG